MNEKGGLGAVCVIAAIGSLMVGLLPLTLLFGVGAWLLFKAQREDDEVWAAKKALEDEQVQQWRNRPGTGGD